MPFPFAALGLLGTIGAIVGTTAAVGVTAAAISVYNDEKRAKAAAAARRQASRERERMLLEERRRKQQEREAKDKEYGMSKEEKERLLIEEFEILAKLEGNSQGLRDQGEIPDDEAAKATEELNAFKKGGIAV